DAIPSQTVEQRDGLDRLKKRIVDASGPLQLTTEYTYDGNGNTATVKDAEGGDIDATYAYDGLNRKIKAEYPLGLSETFVYDADNNLVTHVDKRGTEFDNE